MSWRGIFLKAGMDFDSQRSTLDKAIRIFGDSRTVGGVTVNVLIEDSNGNVLLCTGTSIPTADSSGFAKGCLFIKTDADDGTKSLYENQGTSSLCDFNVIGDIAAAEIALSEGNILVGNSSGEATALNAKTEAYILIGDGTTVASVAVSGDVAITKAGVVSIGTGKVVHSKLKTKSNVALSDADATLTASQLVDSGIFTITPTAARTLTTDTAANIIAALPGYQVGTWFDFTIICQAAFDVTLAAGTGVTIVGSAVVNDASATFKARVDSDTAVTIYRT